MAFKSILKANFISFLNTTSFAETFMELLNFRSQKLKLDFLTFSKPGFDNQQKIRNLANYFYCIHGFNSFLSEGNIRKINETLFFNSKTKDTLIVRINYWNKLVLEFPGKSADKLYHLIQSNAIDWNSLELNDLCLSRIDIYYEQKKSDSFVSDKFDNFLIDSRKHLLLETRTKNIELITNTKGRILGINKRSNPHYYRVYETSTAIRFELELKKSALNNLQRSFFYFQFYLFESNLINLYFQYSITLFPLNNSFVTWLMDFNRKHILNKNNSNLVLVTDYFKIPNHLLQIQYGERLFHLLQFLTFIKTLNRQDYSLSSYFVEGKEYIVQEFYLADFIRFLGIPNTNTRYREKLITYFQILHKADPIVEQFEDGQFRIFATFLFSGVKKVQNRWIVKIYIIEDLYKYIYPFIFSQSFLTYKNKTDCLLKLQIIKSISIQGVKKVFLFAQFIHQLQISRSRINQVKKDFISLIQEMSEEGIIRNNIEIVHKNKKNYPMKQLNINQLKVNDLNQRVLFVVFYETINY